LATEQNIIVKFTSDTSGLQPAIEQMRILGKITDEDARKISEINAEQQKFNATASNTNNEFAEFHSQIKSLATEIKAGVIEGLAEGMKKTTKETTDTVVKVKSLKTELKELKAQIASGSLGEKEMKEATKRAAELTDHLGDVNQRIKALSSDTKRIDAVVEAFRGIAGAVSVATGAMSLFGSENKEIEKTLLKVQGAMALLQGVQELSNLALGDGILKTQLLSTYQKIAGKSATIMGVEISGATAMATGGLTLLLAAVAYLAVELANSTDSVYDLDAAIEKMNGNIDAQRRINDMLIQSMKDGREKDLQAARLANARKLDDLTNLFREQKISAEKYEKEFVLIKKLGRDEEAKINEKYDKEAAEKRKKELDEKTKQNKKLLDIEKAHQAEILANKRLIESELRRLEKEKSDFLKSQKDIELKSENDYSLSYLQELQVRFDLAYAKKVEHDNAIKKQTEDTQKALVAASFQAAGILSNTLFTLTSQNIKGTEDAEIESINRRTQKELQARGVTEVQKAKIEERAAKEIARAKQKAWKDQQRADIAQAVINGALAVTNALATVKPFPAAIIAAGLAGLQTAAQVAIIKNTPTPKFAKGTKKVLGAGTGTSDDIDARLSLGEMVFTNKTAADYNPALTAIFDRKVNPQIANDLLTDLANGSYNINPEYHSTTTNNLDYNKLGQIVKQGQSKVVINIDKNGLLHYKEDSFGKTQYVNSKFKYTL
jgi:hypothetical protein